MSECINEPFRWLYQDANKYDELAFLFPEHVPGLASVPVSLREHVYLDRFHTTANEPHHIAGRMFGAERWDVVTNLIHLCPWTHRFCERYRNDGLALCYAVKLLKSEWDAETMYRITGVPDFGAYLETVDFAFPWVRPTLEKVQRMTDRRPTGETLLEIMGE